MQISHPTTHSLQVRCLPWRGWICGALLCLLGLLVFAVILGDQQARGIVDWRARISADWEGFSLGLALLACGLWLGLARSRAVIWTFDSTMGRLTTLEAGGFGWRTRSYDLGDIFRCGLEQFAGVPQRLYLMLRSGAIVRMPFTLGTAAAPARAALAQINGFLALRRAPTTAPDDNSASRRHPA